ncbi:hypothetical protein PISL3812_00459 [Talaromyces islandicus]|uniref:DUF4211 domain-containing protein n=1 Tax=Talaromyces islandicus TaxID=28573 RepID=A0A0U1LLW0_TALIS|nr:hypothetical protein PISL3812_00459 [Talaromyces islandicus]
MPRTYGKKKQQTRLTFAPTVETASPMGEADAAHSSPLRPARLRYSHPSSSSSSSKRQMVVKGQLQLEDYSAASRSRRNAPPASSSDEGQAMASNMTPKSRKKVPSSSSFPSVKEEHAESSSEGDAIQPSKRRRPFNLVVSDDSESDQKIQVSTPRKQKNKMTKSSRVRDSRKKADDTDESEYSAPKTRSTLGTKRQLPSGGGSPPRKKSLLVDLTGLAESETSDAEALVTTPPSSRKRKTVTPKMPQDTFVIEDDSESDIVPVSRKRNTPKSKQTISIEDDDDDSSDDVVTSTPARRILKKSPHTPRGPPRGSQKTPLSRQDELDIQEDLEDLMDTAVKQSRTRGAPANSERSKRQRHLDLLRRRRAGEKDSTDAADSADVREEEDSDGGDRDAGDSSEDAVSFPRINVYDYHRGSDNDSDVESEVDADEELDQDDASFVDADEDDTMGVPAARVPFEFSRHRTKQPRQCFRDVVEWMVHNKLNPAFERHDEIYQFAFRKLGDEVVGRAGSQLISPVWNTDFSKALRARPYIDVTSFPTSEFYDCAACNRTNHPASSDIRLFGEPYSEETLEPLYDSDEEDEEDDDDDEEEEGEEEHSKSKKGDRDREGNLIPAEDQHFYLGKHCKANAVLAHTLLHWRFSLYEWVVDYLDAKEGLFDPQRSVERENLSRKKRAKMANNVVDMMDRNGEIQRLWRDFHHTLKAAREKTG